MSGKAAAAVLWPDLSAPRAAANLRNALWESRVGRVALVATDGLLLRLADLVRVNAHTAFEVASRVNDAMSPLPRRRELLVMLADLVPDWDEEWVVVAGERYRQARLHAHQRACDAGRLSRYGRPLTSPSR
jgi:DNA-binding SARP family transcriptional activator